VARIVPTPTTRQVLLQPPKTTSPEDRTIVSKNRGTASQKTLPSLALLAIGVVFGDIGTSPIYAFKACFGHDIGIPLSPANVYGAVSLIVWALTLTVSIKYIAFIMRADNNGEGGILALLALIRDGRTRDNMPRNIAVLVSLGLFGAALLYGDGMITPAISVLSAIEGLGVATPEFSRFAVPISVIILLLLFRVQKYGTHRVGAFFGPIMVVWFLAIGALGIAEIIRAPMILAAVSPYYAINFFVTHGLHGFIILGAVVLAVTGAEALYADMGYFGPRPIRVAWFALVFPTLLLNYAGQGALLLRDPSALDNPFYHMAPHVLVMPLVGLATAATIIASQALISGAFTLTNQTVQLGFSPRLEVRHTAPESEQIYVPSINTVLTIGCIILVLAFRTSGALGAAYGIAVTGTMGITTVLFVRIARTQWKWPPLAAFGLGTLFAVVDLSFLGANLLKVRYGGWVPLAIALVLWTLMTTWDWGRAVVMRLRRQGSVPLDDFFARLDRDHVPRVEGTAIYLTSHPEGVPRVLLRELDVMHVLHKEVVLLSVDNQERPYVPQKERVTVVHCPHGFYRVAVHYGFLQQPNLADAISECRPDGIALSGHGIVYFLNGERLILRPERNIIKHWRKQIFAFEVRNARPASTFFGLPSNQVVELGQEVTI
jgi:KUP system potassium uptake protein